jgi:demethylmenaquinone methyltransferase / 2-methoxy-6-polyprenyl-1,4-benzoquinol methylase
VVRRGWKRSKLGRVQGMSSQTAMPSRSSEQFSEQVNRMFDRVAPRYDALNATMSAGLDRRWRERAAEVADVPAGGAVLDVCCGTGDLAVEMARQVGPAGTVVGCDFSLEMLSRAVAKASELDISHASFDHADALRLPYPDGRFNAVTMGFGLRNLGDHRVGISEMARVARSGGRVVVLEFTRPRRLPFSAFFDIWFNRLVPLLGRFSFDASAYSYLPASVRHFPGPDAVAALMADVGLAKIRYRILAGGIVAIHVGTKL